MATLAKSVTSNADSGAGSLRGHIAAAASGDSIVFANPLDGAIILLTTFSNDLSTGSTQFGPSAFFITGNKTLTIDATANGLTQGVVIIRASGTANFRLFDVDSGSSLTLRGLTLSNGAAVGFPGNGGGGSLGAGGAIFNRGVLTLWSCTLTSNVAAGGTGAGLGRTVGGSGVGQSGSANDGGGPNGGASGSGYSSVGGGFGGGGAYGDHYVGPGGPGVGGFGGGGGAIGDSGGPNRGGSGGFGGGGGGNFVTLGGFGGGFGGGGGAPGAGGGGGGGLGGAIFNDAGTVSLTNVTLTANAANGGGSTNGGTGNGSGYGGAIFNYAGSVTLEFGNIEGNSVAAGTGGGGGSADGSAIYSLGDSAAACSAGGNICGTSGNASLVMNNTIAMSNTGGANDVAVGAINAGTSNRSGAYNLIGATTGFHREQCSPRRVVAGRIAREVDMQDDGCEPRSN